MHPYCCSAPNNYCVAPISCCGAPSSCCGAPISCCGAPNGCCGAPNGCCGAPISCFSATSSCYGAPLSCYGAPRSCCGAHIVKTAVSYTLLPGFWIYMDRPIQRYHLAVSPLPCYSLTCTPYPFSGTLICTLFSLSFMVVRDHGIVCWVCNFSLYK